MKLPDYKRSDLENYSLTQLRDLAQRYELEALGRPSDPRSWINSLSGFQKIACRQWVVGKIGLGKSQHPHELVSNCEGFLEQVLSALGEPTPEQLALIRAYLIHGEEPEDREMQDLQQRMVARFAVRDALYTALQVLRLRKYQV